QVNDAARELHETLARLASATGEAADTRGLLLATRAPFACDSRGTRVHLIAEARLEGDRAVELRARALVDWCEDLETARACLGADAVGTEVARTPCPTCAESAWRVVRERVTAGGGVSSELLVVCGHGHRVGTHRAHGSLSDRGRVVRTPAAWPEPWRTWASSHATLAARIAEAWRPARHDHVAFSTPPTSSYARELVSDEAHAAALVPERLRALAEMPRSACVCGGEAFLLHADTLSPGSYDAEWDLCDVLVCFACGQTTSRELGRGGQWPR
ncbi:MAG: hypothetical protein H6721_32630, partial [Sandaracinus sp.]|nr:hypothetical protein [Sandaracinus sp.]